jgi:hypothetical protein
VRPRFGRGSAAAPASRGRGRGGPRGGARRGQRGGGRGGGRGGAGTLEQLPRSDRAEREEYFAKTEAPTTLFSRDAAELRRELDGCASGLALARGTAGLVADCVAAEPELGARRARSAGVRTSSFDAAAPRRIVDEVVAGAYELPAGELTRFDSAEAVGRRVRHNESYAAADADSMALRVAAMLAGVSLAKKAPQRT